MSYGSEWLGFYFVFTANPTTVKYPVQSPTRVVFTQLEIIVCFNAPSSNYLQARGWTRE